MSQLTDIKLGSLGDIAIDEAGGTLSFVVNVTIAGTPDQFTVPVPIAPILTSLASGVTNPLVKWALSFVISML